MVARISNPPQFFQDAGEEVVRWLQIEVGQVAELDKCGSVMKAVAVADITTVDATNLATAITLANDTKAKVNALLASLRTSGVLDT